MSKYWKYFYPGYVWALPMTVIGFVLASVFYKAHSWAWRQGVLTCLGTHIWGDPDAQTLGWIQVYRDETCRGYADLRVHENTHVVQAFMGGLVGFVIAPLLFALLGWSPVLALVLGGFAGGVGFAIIYGILFLYLLLKQTDGNWVSAYLKIPFEVHAYGKQDNYLVNPDSKPWGAE